jgi:nucleotide-binding universal stress UspA family protein
MAMFGRSLLGEDHDNAYEGRSKMIVVAGVDDSPVSKTVVTKAIQEAEWREAELHVVHVVQFPAVYADVPMDLSELAEAQREVVWESVAPILTNSAIPVQRVDLEGYPPDQLVAYASAQAASLLVVGTRGHGEFASLILGSTSHRAIHLAECDVLVVKAKEADEG